jgi:hypothetical protein
MWVFSPSDVRTISVNAEDRDRTLKVRIDNDLDWTRVAQHLGMAVEFAVRCDAVQQWQADPRRHRKRYERIVRDVGRLGQGLPPPVIHELGQCLIRMMGAHTETNGQDGSGVSRDGQYRPGDAFLIEQTPRTLALLSMLAGSRAHELAKSRSLHDQSDQLTKQLFMQLVGAHGTIFGRSPRTRQKTGTIADGGSIGWARDVLRHAVHSIKSSLQEELLPIGPGQHGATRDATPYLARLKELADLSDRRLGDLLDQAWRDCEKLFGPFRNGHFRRPQREPASSA